MNYTDAEFNIRQSQDQDAVTIELLRRSQEQQTFTFSNNMNTAVHMDYMGFYVDSSIEVRDTKE